VNDDGEGQRAAGCTDPFPSFPLNGEGEWKVRMKRETKKSLDEQRRIVAYLDGLQAKVLALRELQSKTQEELAALLPSVLDKAFKGEL
jgi:hypothetical protein